MSARRQAGVVLCRSPPVVARHSDDAFIALIYCLDRQQAGSYLCDKASLCSARRTLPFLQK